MKKNKKKTADKNFCEVCGLREEWKETSEEGVKKREDFLKKLEDLDLREKNGYIKNLNIHVSEFIKVFEGGAPPSAKGTEPLQSRTSTVTSSSEFLFCSVDSKKWTKKGLHCKDFQLKLEPMERRDFLSIHAARKISRTQNKLLLLGIIVSIFGLVIILYGTEIKNFFENLFRLIFFRETVSPSQLFR